MKNTKKISANILPILLILSLCINCTRITQQTDTNQIVFTFYATADMRKYSGENPNHFRGACEAINALGPGTFMISPGDIDPPERVYHTTQTYIDGDYLWYPVVGNHEAETAADMSWLRDFNINGTSLPYIINLGPAGTEETTYSFDYGNVHFVILNQYYDGVSDCGSKGDMVDELHQWLKEDLEKNKKPIVFVCGHEPAYPQPDQENGRLRHQYDSLNMYPENRDRFWSTLIKYEVMAYVCGHTHNFSMIKVNEVWQIDVGHARGTADPGARSTFIQFHIYKNNTVEVNVYRMDAITKVYLKSMSTEI